MVIVLMQMSKMVIAMMEMSKSEKNEDCIDENEQKG